jgi:hypothetical protein
MSSQYSFLSAVRAGMAAQPWDDATARREGRARFDVHVDLKLDGQANRTRSAAVSLQMFGPGDVRELDARHVAHVEPPPGTRDFEPSKMAFIEFSKPELPWLFSLKSGTRDVKPWLCLLVLPVSDSVAVRTRPPAPNPVLEADDLPAGSLPDLTNADWWAHVQVNGDWNPSHAQFERLMREQPERIRSRLLSPLRLQAETDYLACLVPATQGGVAAALGREPDAARIAEPAFSVNANSLRLPVFHHWHFRTGLAGDFETLVRRLKPRSLPSASSGLGVTVGRNQFKHQPETEDSYWQAKLQGVLRPPAAAPHAPEELPEHLADDLEAQLERDALLESETEEPVIALPRYGGRHAGVGRVPAAGGQPPWLRELNLDPRHRAAAGVGTTIVRKHQDRYMTLAWEQVGQIREANRFLQQAQMSREVSKAIHHRLASLSDAQLVNLTSSVHVRTLAPDGEQTIAASLASSAAPAGSTSAALRRMLRTRGPQFGSRAQPGQTAKVFEDLANCKVDLNADEHGPGKQPFIPFVGADGKQYQEGEQLPPEFLCETLELLLEKLKKVEATDPDKHAVAKAINRHYQDFLEKYIDALKPPKNPPKKPDLGSLGEGLRLALDPEVTIPALVDSRLRVPAHLRDPDDRLGPVLAAPDIPIPMYNPLREQNPDFILPGVGDIPNNTLTVAETNPHFIESYMVGLNHEMGRELLWRGFPTDTRGTVFRQFWDVRGAVGNDVASGGQQDAAAREALRDINPIHTWQRNAELGTNMRGAGEQGRIVLLVKGDLLRRFPDTIIYAVQAQWVSEGLDNDARWVRRPLAFDAADLAAPDEGLGDLLFPSFHGRMSPDITMLGFDLTTDAACGSTDRHDNNPGYFFVIQQPPIRTAFGLDEADGQLAPPQSWDDLAWEHPDVLRDGHLHTGGNAPRQPGAHEAQWGDRSADMAEILFVKPYRTAIHADDMLIKPLA